MKSRRGSGQRRSSWRTLVRTQGTEMGPSRTFLRPVRPVAGPVRPQREECGELPAASGARSQKMDRGLRGSLSLLRVRLSPTQRPRGVWAEEGVPRWGQDGTGRTPDSTWKPSSRGGGWRFHKSSAVVLARVWTCALTVLLRLCYWQNETLAPVATGETVLELLSNLFENCRFRAASLA